MAKKDSIKDKKKDLEREVNKDDSNIWKAAANKSWSIVEFGVYIVLLAFTIFAVGYYVPTVLNKTEPTARFIDSDYDSLYFKLDDYCDNIYDCVVELEEDDQVSYVANADTYELSVNDVTINLENPVEEFAVLKNDFIATFEVYDGSEYLITYYNGSGEIVKQYKTLLSSMGKLNQMNGTYATCNDNELEVKEYQILSEGTFKESVTGSFESPICR